MGQEKKWKDEKGCTVDRMETGEERTWKEDTYGRGKEAVMEEKVDRGERRWEIGILGGNKKDVQYI
jgi:hypothetical protein